MSTRTHITVHVGPDDSYDSVIARLLNQGFTISIGIEQVDNIEANAERVAVKERIKAQRAEADAFIAERTEREALRHAKDRARAMRVAAAEAMHGVEPLSVECRTCGARVGKPCERASGQVAQRPHTARARDAYTAKGR